MEEIVKYLALPSNLIIICFMLGLLLVLVRKAKRLGFFLLTVAVLFYIIFGTGPVSYWLLGNLEYRYPPLRSFDRLDRVDAIVVLAGHGESDLNRPISSEVNSSSAFRIIETIRIFKHFPNAEILISGQGDVPEIMKRLAVSLGLPSNRITIENQSTNTYESAINVPTVLADKPFILVTSAGHMSRSMGVFQKLGMKPIPAPTDYMTRKNYLAISYLPSPIHLMYSDLAVHEYLGLVWYRLTNRL